MKSCTHLALDVKPPYRFTVSNRAGALTIHDTARQREWPLWTVAAGNRHGHRWTPHDAHQLCDWLNERARGYPRSPNIEALRR
jgi:hypothetical protein